MQRTCLWTIVGLLAMNAIATAAEPLPPVLAPNDGEELKRRIE